MNDVTPYHNVSDLSRSGGRTLQPPTKKAVGCKLVFSPKQNVDGSVEMFKEILVAKGYAQSYRIDFQETFALVAKLNTVNILMSIVNCCKFRLEALST